MGETWCEAPVDVVTTFDNPKQSGNPWKEQAWSLGDVESVICSDQSETSILRMDCAVQIDDLRFAVMPNESQMYHKLANIR